MYAGELSLFTAADAGFHFVAADLGDHRAELRLAPTVVDKVLIRADRIIVHHADRFVHPAIAHAGDRIKAQRQPALAGCRDRRSVGAWHTLLHPFTGEAGGAAAKE